MLNVKSEIERRALLAVVWLLGKVNVEGKRVASFYPLGRVSHVMNKVWASHSSARLAVTKPSHSMDARGLCEPSTRFVPHHSRCRPASRTDRYSRVKSFK